jgi:hypothetical protein
MMTEPSASIGVSMPVSGSINQSLYSHKSNCPSDLCTPRLSQYADLHQSDCQKDSVRENNGVVFDGGVQAKGAPRLVRKD